MLKGMGSAEAACHFSSAMLKASFSAAVCLPDSSILFIAMSGRLQASWSCQCIAY